ncbi:MULTISPECIES: nucleotide exchange factor GrpE [unclassified Leifsonia]|uniref:nucleotide exchange factor GrpE n=1 Tax=unclassified Leifsonia TaxID=2663824 RepID=UPI000700CA90|nr:MULTISPECIES: nucleotide exchange factor GrpE [unclassified Leifsonia]KQX05030.1 molecular chaperone GrpE [Leifsonia sp. Root1293]KRA08662.1 molecular chaperone GrpE [Leifsonia sp. Root60]
MADDRDNENTAPEPVDGPEQSQTDGASAQDAPEAGLSGADVEEGFEGPDVETSLSDADLSFLSGQSSAEELAEQHLTDLKRVTAEYANYRKRTDANREVERERSMGEVVKILLPVLDDLDRAEKHGDLEGESAFSTIASKLRTSVERLGLTPFGTVGDLFDPNIHEAIFQQPTDEVETDTVADVVETGYYLGSSMLRAAKVVVKVPA